VVLGLIAAIIVAVVVLIVFFAIAGFIIQLLASSSRDNNIDYSSRRGRMAVCKIPFTLDGIFYYHDMPYLGFESISNEYIYG
jgi:Na+-driven multidrug efflux pump